MEKLLTYFGFPPPAKRDAVRFHFAKKLPYQTRMILIFFLFFLGLILQAMYLSALAGLPFIIIGIILSLVKGYDSRARLKTFTIDPNWTDVDLEKIQELDQLRQRNQNWDRDGLDVSNPKGCFVLALVILICGAFAFLLGALTDAPNVAFIILANAVVIILPLWFSGMKFILKQPNLAIKVKIILDSNQIFQSLKKDGESLKPALMLTKKEGKTVPIDAKFSVHFKDKPSGFYGLQSQININVVQGASFPYFYCVLAAKPGFELYDHLEQIKPPEGIITEFQADENAEVIVIRQKTTKKSGYHSKPKRCAEILEVSLNAARLILEKSG